MCGQIHLDNKESPERKLQGLMVKELNVFVDHVLLRMFIKCYWDQIASLAHKIHDGE